MKTMKPVRVQIAVLPLEDLDSWQSFTAGSLRGAGSSRPMAVRAWAAPIMYLHAYAISGFGSWTLRDNRWQKVSAALHGECKAEHDGEITGNP